ncbi:hypothetical protein FOMPIDRAFT_1140473 [Fomitopsis schrenkii]|uniref:Uncharacterized protein n=1 Tax=Fomitopsis schrenkii TaxID=2126942 RepID=S8EKP5_FOMSC|nr:hypothetical protein FOMPIDRAFT_1140473 [Fomitopsis schrenkii]
MASCFATVFSCCIRRGPSSGPVSPDERTHLIPPTSDEPSHGREYVVDHQQLNARLGPIVRAKEGKMVNVNTPLPFNLYNQQLHDPSGSASRPASAHLDPNTHRRVSYSPPRDDSASPSIPTSRSTSSLQPGDASYLPPEADPEYGRRPVLSVRLIRGAPGNGIWTRRGRSVTRGRYSRFGDDASSSGQSQLEQKVWDGNVHANGDAAPDAGGQEHRKEQIGVVIRVGDDSQADGSAESTPHPPLGLSPVADADTEADAGTVPPPDFRIEISDVGKISQSWGD